MATNTEPGRTWRESYSTPVTGALELPVEPTAEISAMRSFQFISWLIVVGSVSDFIARSSNCTAMTRHPVRAGACYSGSQNRDPHLSHQDLSVGTPDPGTQCLALEGSRRSIANPSG